tara:strand:+ start:337 stop:528 length:192 start_codon:yes stop_codon:yes gene_type:complete
MNFQEAIQERNFQGGESFIVKTVCWKDITNYTVMRNQADLKNLRLFYRNWDVSIVVVENEESN